MLTTTAPFIYINGSDDYNDYYDDDVVIIIPMKETLSLSMTMIMTKMCIAVINRSCFRLFPERLEMNAYVWRCVYTV